MLGFHLVSEQISEIMPYKYNHPGQQKNPVLQLTPVPAKHKQPQSNKQYIEMNK